ncbi:hypothetical protein CEXT_693881 [Caerostris extrusa]|uniref:Uncharacterized protein n=1 Tax=Caerostris extrusa TaxID=172846 RepID=A0AAV4SIC3_CAEEX|nr:hypothetical protein CEXT_693881 [Caerostris extrusa]
MFCLTKTKNRIKHGQNPPLQNKYISPCTGIREVSKFLYSVTFPRESCLTRKYQSRCISLKSSLVRANRGDKVSQLRNPLSIEFRGALARCQGDTVAANAPY